MHWYKEWTWRKWTFEINISTSLPDEPIFVHGHVERESFPCGARYKHSTFWFNVLNIHAGIARSEKVRSCDCDMPLYYHYYPNG